MLGQPESPQEPPAGRVARRQERKREALVQAGYRNRYGHPAREVMASLRPSMATQPLGFEIEAKDLAEAIEQRLQLEHLVPVEEHVEHLVHPVRTARLDRNDFLQPMLASRGGVVPPA